MKTTQPGSGSQPQHCQSEPDRPDPLDIFSISVAALQTMKARCVQFRDRARLLSVLQGGIKPKQMAW